MKTEQMVVIGFGVALVAIAALWEVSTGMPKRSGAEITPETLKIGLKNPPLWIFYNDSDVNSRNWADFGARSSRAINIPLLNLTYQTIVKQNGRDYRVEVIGGLQGVAERLGGWGAMPKTLQNPRAKLSTAEEDWIRTAVLKKYGGLWLSASAICLRPFGKLSSEKVVGFGQDTTPLYGSSVPGFRALWSPYPEHPMFVEWEKRIRDRLENQLGGLQIRGDAKSDWEDLCQRGCEVLVKAEGGRDAKTNKVLELEDLFASGTGGVLPFTLSPAAVYVPIPYQDLLNRRHFGWILRNSEEQIMESDIAIRYLLERALGPSA